MQPRNLGLYLALLLFAAATARPQLDYDYDDNYDEEELPLPEFTIEPQRLIAKMGDTVVIPCTSTYSEIYVMVIKKMAAMESLLYVGNVKVDRNDKYRLIGSSLEISHLDPSDSGDYVCSIQVSQGPIKLTHTLEVLSAPDIRIKPGQQQNLWLSKGDSVTLECEAIGNPDPIVRWTRLEGRLPSGSEEKEGHSITLEDVDRHVEGHYICSADNGVGEVATQNFTVSVYHAPEVTAEEVNIVTGMGNQVTLTCLVYASPSAVVVWTKEGHVISSNTNILKQEGHRHTISIQQMQEGDFGTYVCQAGNSLGQSDVAIHVTEGSQPIEEEERGPEIMDERINPIQEEREHQIEKGRGNQIEEERAHEIQEERDHQIEDEKGHQIIAERDYPVRKEKKPATDRDWQKLIIIASDLAHLLGKMWENFRCRQACLTLSVSKYIVEIWLKQMPNNFVQLKIRTQVK